MLKIPESHAGFSLSKKEQDDMTVGLANDRHVICKFCKNILIPEGLACKVIKNVSSSTIEIHWFINPNCFCRLT